MRDQMKTRSGLLVAGLCSVLGAACGGGSNGNSTATGVQASLTDSPACGYDHVYVTVASVGINSRVDGGGTWTDIILSPPERIDLLSLSNGTLETLGQAALPAGTYQQLRLVLSPNSGNSAPYANSVVPHGGTETALKTPSAAQSGLKISTRGPFTVQAGTLVDLVLDFNACRSIVTTGRSKGANVNSASGYLLKPVITATPEVVSGTIDGYVDAADATTTVNGVTTPGATVYAEREGVIVRGTIADSSGHFALFPLEQSSSAGNYDVVIVNAGKASDIIQGVPVSAQATTSLSTAAMPFVLAESLDGTVNGTVNVSADATVDASQNINGSAEVIAETNADSSTGAYDLMLAVASPQAALYSATLPILPVPVAAQAGQYTITATAASGNTSSSAASVTANGITVVDFPNLQ